MALLPFTGLETHPTGTTNLNAIINGNWEILDALIGDITGENGLTTLSYAATIDVPLETSKPLIQSSLTGNATFTISGLVAGLSRVLILIGDGTPRTLTWPATAVWAGTALATLPANSTRLVYIAARGTDESDIVLCQIGGSAGGAGATPSWEDQNLAVLTTTTDEDDVFSGGVWAAFGATPSGRVDVVLNQSRFCTVGDGAKDKDCYFSADAGTTALAHTAIATATSLHWMGSVAGFELAAATDKISLNYATA